MKKYIGLEDMGNANCACVLNLVRNYGEISRKEISAITSLSWGGMTKIVNKLFESGYIVEGKSETQSGLGRIPMVISINKCRNFVIGLDVNRVGLSAYVVNLAGDVIQEYWEDGVFDTKSELLQTLLSFLGRIVEEYQEFHIMAIGVAMQGILDAERGISVQFPHCTDWENVPIRDILKDAFGIEVFVEHDPNCILYSEMRKNGKENILLMRLDSSIGMAVSVAGHILKGDGLLEVAHQIVVPGGKPCKCGQYGCLEAYIAPCFVKKELKPEAVKEMLLPLAVCMRNMGCLFKSEEIILTGNLMKYHSLFKKDLLDLFYQYCDTADISVRFVDETNLAVYGAALIAAHGAIDQTKL